MVDKYFYDTRIQAIRKNYDMSFQAPELWSEVVITDNDTLQGCHQYVYSNGDGDTLSMIVSIEMLNKAQCNFDMFQAEYLKNNNFNAKYIVHKFWYMSLEDFENIAHAF